ncbi:MAG: ABC transporter substrate-binding protein [Defluviitaleaceae bacterium]|nr:ABC transporter substrate-binding protein [Defluviitaleaceae bacterium]
MVKFLLLPLLLLILAACGGEPPNLAQLDPNFANSAVSSGNESDEPADNEPEPVAQVAFANHLNVAMPMPRTLNPLLNSDPHLAQVLRLIFEPIVIFDEQLQPHANPAIIESIVFAPSGQSLTITLRQNIFWEDGTPITSADLAFSIDVLRNQAPATAVYRNNVAYIANHSMLDDHALHINLHYPMWQMKYLLDFPIIPREYYSPVPMTNLTHPRNMHPVGNGAFRFYDYALASHLELIPNTNAPGGRPHIDGVTALILRDMNDAPHAFEQGLIDILPANAADWGRLRAMGKNEGGIIPSTNLDFIGFNHNRTIFAEREVRLAVASALNWNSLMPPGSDRAFAPLNPISWLAVDVEETPSATFADAGFVLGAGGFLQRQISPALPPLQLAFDIIVNAENHKVEAVAQSLADALVAEGVNATLHILAENEFQNRINTADFDLVVGTTTLQTRPNMDFTMGYNSHYLSNLLHAANRAVTPTALSVAAADVQDYFAQNLPIIPITFRNRTLFAASHIGGNLSPSAHNIFHNAHTWRIP